MDEHEELSSEIWVNEFKEVEAQKFRVAVLKASKADPIRPIVIYIDSYGGQVDALAKMIATLDEIPNTVITVAMGKAMSCGAVLLSHGDIRFCDTHSRVMVHEVSSGTFGDVHDMKADVKETARLNEYFLGLLAKNCGIKGGYSKLRQIIKEQDGRDRYFDAAAAKEFGIVDIVGLPKVSASFNYEVTVVAPRKSDSGVQVKTKKSKSKPKRKSETKR
jgi:ATP-dependent Clp protease protease subunit